jgi:predicted acylesterase/phospholipase RssA
MPTIFSPVPHEGDLLVDGGMLNQLPIDVMHEFSGGGPIIAVDVSPDFDLVGDYHFGTSVSGWGALAGKLNPFASDTSAPLIYENLLRSVTLYAVYQAKVTAALADLCIHPPVDRIGILDFGAYADIIEIGYRSAQEVLANWTSGGRGEVTSSLPPAAQLGQALSTLDALLERLQYPVGQ